MFPCSKRKMAENRRKQNGNNGLKPGDESAVTSPSNSPRHHGGTQLDEVLKSAGPSLIQLKKEINFFSGCGIIIGNIVGSGIFITSKGVLEKSGSPGLALGIWTLSGLISLIGAYCYTELGTLIQTSGGDYAYINESYGKLYSFLYAYIMAFLTVPCMNAIFGMTVAIYIVNEFCFYSLLSLIITNFKVKARSTILTYDPSCHTSF